MRGKKQGIHLLDTGLAVALAASTTYGFAAVRNAPAGAPCKRNVECLSRKCDSGLGSGQTRRCVPRPGKGRPGEFCSHHGQCASKQCELGKNRAKGGRCAQPKRAAGKRLGQGCKKGSECQSGQCSQIPLPVSGVDALVCVPRPGTGKQGDFCTADPECKSGQCQRASSSGRGSCASGGSAQESGMLSALGKKLNRPGGPLRGFIDLHTHPMAHLGFGKKLIHGAPGVGVLMASGTIHPCNKNASRARSIAQALGSCYATHGGHDLFKNGCGNHIRRLVLNGVEDGNKANKPHDVEHPDGFPSFTRWPRHNDILHQQMWVDWVKRAYEAGQRVMVALTVNSVTLARGVQGDAPYDDKSTSDVQLEETADWVKRSGFMELAFSSEDVRRIVGQDKMAVILGTEVDDLGSFMMSRAMRAGKAPSAKAMRSEIQRLHRAGVRYMLPVHITDNYLGGAAVYGDDFARANRYQFGQWWKLKCAQKSDGVSHKVKSGWDLVIASQLGAAGGTQPVPKNCPYGHVNARGLTKLGRAALDEMMRLGIMIDIDHSSQETVRGIVAHTGSRAYPLLSGHNGLRGGNDSAENNRTPEEYQTIRERKGMAGFGFSERTATRWLTEVRAALRAAGKGLYFGLGSDANGMAKLPPPRRCPRSGCVEYTSTFPRLRTEARLWDYNRDGVAHYGLIADFLRDAETHGGQDVIDQFFDGAEGFARVWEATEEASKRR